MTYQEAHQIVEDYFLDHARALTETESKAFLIMLLATPLVPDSVQPHIVRIAEASPF